VLLEYSEPSGKLLGDIEGPQSLERHATELKTSHVKAYKSQHDGLATTLTERSQLSEQHASVPEVHGVYLRTTCSGRKAGGARHILVHTSPNVDTACADNPDERSDQPLREFQSALACKETTTEIRATMQSSAFQLRLRFAELRAGSGVDRVHATPELQAGPSADRVCVTSWASACERLEARAQVVWPGLYQGEPAGFMPWKGSLAEKGCADCRGQVKRAHTAHVTPVLRVDGCLTPCHDVFVDQESGANPGDYNRKNITARSTGEHPPEDEKVTTFKKGGGGYS
jgi:hypothetical protein